MQVFERFTEVKFDNNLSLGHGFEYYNSDVLLNVKKRTGEKLSYQYY